MTFRGFLRCFLLCIAVSCGPCTQAMTTDPNGTGQVLIFPYYTVNKNQNTLVTVKNTTAVGKAVQVIFREGYNGQAVYGIDVYLKPHQTWATGVFAWSDAGEPLTGVGISQDIDVCAETFVGDLSSNATPGIPNYHFSSAEYAADGGPTSDTRQREGSIEVIELAEIQGLSLASLSTNCSLVISNPATPSDFTAPGGGLIGGVAVVNVSQGTYFSFEPQAIDGFRSEAILPPRIAGLDDAGDDNLDNVSAFVNHAGSFVTATYPGTHAIDAVSALFMASSLFGDIDASLAAGANTDWVLTFPTKHFYVNQPAGADPSPFTHLFMQSGDVGSIVPTALSLFGRDGSFENACQFDSCPPLPPFLEYQTQIISFTQQPSNNSAVFGSALVSAVPTPDVPSTGELMFVSGLLANSNEGLKFFGVPVFGAQAVNYVNDNVTAGVLANYSGASRLKATVSTCESGVGFCP